MFPYITIFERPGMIVNQAVIAAIIDPTIAERETYFLIFKVEVKATNEHKPTNQETKMVLEKVHAAALPPLKEAKIGKQWPATTLIMIK